MVLRELAYVSAATPSGHDGPDQISAFEPVASRLEIPAMNAARLGYPGWYSWQEIRDLYKILLGSCRIPNNCRAISRRSGNVLPLPNLYYF
jgi:hypothetical protein